MKKIYVIINCLLIVNIAVAQSHEFSIHAGGGLSSLSYKFAAGKTEGGIGGGGGVGYTYYINDNFGIATGLGVALYGAKTTSDAFSDQYDIQDNNDNLRFTYSIAGGYEENQRATLLTIPVMLQYRAPFGYYSSMSFYAAGGVKLGLPMSAKATIMSNNTTSGYYSYENLTYENLPQHGFVNEMEGDMIKSDIDLGLATILALEAGLHFSLGETTGLYTGLFLDYGVNNIQKSKDKHVIEYQPANSSQFKYNSILNSGMVDKINLMSVGIKVKIAFGI
jgi:hypothetical protein